MTLAAASLQLQQITERLRQRTRNELAHIVLIAKHWIPGDLDRLQELQRIAHWIAGTASLFDCNCLGSAARNLDIVSRSNNATAIEIAFGELLTSLDDVFPAEISQRQAP